MSHHYHRITSLFLVDCFEHDFASLWKTCEFQPIAINEGFGIKKIANFKFNYTPKPLSGLYGLLVISLMNGARFIKMKCVQ
jgi:hypothetical protein